ncbi:MAG: glycosyl transferase, partial [Lachnospiraceae bacterium]|nr:glycosyl transferase [Lachnospiraceae bacterium]
FNEKIQWLKLYDHNPIYPQLIDKYIVKKFVAEKIGEEYVIPNLGVWSSFDEIDFDKLPDQFVLKCTHDSGGVVIVKDKGSLDISEAKKKLEKSLQRNYYYSGREWGYKNIKPRIIGEMYLEDKEYMVPNDYKIFNFDGKARLIQVDFDRFVNHRRNLYDTDWNYIDASIQYPKDPNTVIKKPEQLNVMLELSEKLSAGFPHVRTDFYVVNDRIYFGEMTFWHGSGFEKFEPEQLGITMGEWLKLPRARK